MPKHKVSGLEGPLLDLAVAMVLEIEYTTEGYYPVMVWYRNPNVQGWEPFSPSTNWAQGGPLSEQARISCVWMPSEEQYCAWYPGRKSSDDVSWGDAELQAKMRCLVASKFGEWVELPDLLAA